MRKLIRGAADALLFTAFFGIAAVLVGIGIHAANAEPTKVFTGGTSETIVLTSPDSAITAASGNVANASAIATLAANVTRRTFITGFQCTASGATAGLPVNVTVVGVITGTMTYSFTFPAGVLVGATPLVVAFPTPVPSSAINTAIVVTMPAGGAGNTNAACAAQGYQL